MIKQLLLGIFATVTLASAAQSVSALPVTPQQFIAQAQCPGRFLTLPAWYRGLPGDTDCKPAIKKIDQIWIIVLNAVEMMSHVVVYAATGYVIWGGFRYMTADGAPDKISAAKTTISQALVGVAISVLAIAIINFIVDSAL